MYVIDAIHNGFKLLSNVDLRGADLSEADLRGADLSEANLRRADLSEANLRRADLSGADLSEADLSGANLRGANLRGADLSGANLSWANLSGAALPSPISIDKCAEGWVAYKYVGETTHSPPDSWVFEPGQVIEEQVNRVATDECGCGVNICTADWAAKNPLSYGGDIWKVLIRWEWAHLMVIPYNSDGKFRCGKCELLERVE